MDEAEKAFEREYPSIAGRLKKHRVANTQFMCSRPAGKATLGASFDKIHYESFIAGYRAAQAATRWHPYPEEKPEVLYRHYFVTFQIVTYRYIKIAHYFPHDGDNWTDNDNPAIAWMEIPAPYQPEEAEHGR